MAPSCREEGGDAIRSTLSANSKNAMTVDVRDYLRVQSVKVAAPILVVEEARHPVVVPLHDVLGDAGKIEARQSGHGRSLPQTRCPHPRISPILILRKSLCHRS